MNRLMQALTRREDIVLQVSYPWIFAFAVISTISGWHAASYLVQSPSTSIRIVSAVAFPMVVGMFLLIHEFGHFWYAARSSNDQRQFTIYITGTIPTGFTLPSSPGVEIRNALAGPAVSLLLATLLLSPLTVVSADTIIGAMLLALGVVNFVIGSVNMLPAMPMDGGRILRAIFWFLSGTQPAGTRAAYFYGQVTAAGALGFGIFALTWRPDLLVLGLWTTALAWMVIQSSRHELLRSTLIARAGAVRAADSVAGLNPTIRAAAPIAEAVDILLEQRSNGPGLVRDRDRYVGTLTLEMIREIPRSTWDKVLVSEAMVPLDSLIDSEPGARLLDVLRMQEGVKGNPLIVRHDGGDVAGLISEDIAPRTLLRRAEERSFDMIAGDPSGEPPRGT